MGAGTQPVNPLSWKKLTTQAGGNQRFYKAAAAIERAPRCALCGSQTTEILALATPSARFQLALCGAHVASIKEHVATLEAATPQRAS